MGKLILWCALGALSWWLLWQAGGAALAALKAVSLVLFGR